MNSASDLVDFARRNIDERGMRIEKDGEDAVKLVDKDRGVVLAKFKSVDDMIESYGPKTPDLNYGNADNYIEAINPTGSRVDNMINLNMGDMYGMLPRGATKIKSEGGVNYYKDGNDFYATTYNPDVGEEDVIGYHLAKDGSAELQVVNEMKGKGIGAELSYQFRKNNPEAPSGGLSEAGERTARKTYDRLKAEGIVGGTAALGLLAASPESEAGVVTEGMKTFSEESQKYLQRVLDKAPLADLPEEAIDQGYKSYVLKHAGAPNILEYNLDAPKVNAGLTPEGLYTTVREGRAENYLNELERKGEKGELYPLVTRAEDVFVLGSDKPNAAMMEAYEEFLVGRFGNRDRPYIEDKLDQFARSGHIGVDMTRKQKSNIYRAGGADALLDGEDFVSLYPEQMRDIDAEFDTNLMQANNLLASPAPVGAVGGLLATEAATPEGQLNPLLAVPAEIGSALNEAVVGTVDFLVPDTVNAVSELIGSEYRMPRLSDQELVRLYTQGGYMDEGYGRDAIRTATGLLSPL